MVVQLAPIAQHKVVPDIVILFPRWKLLCLCTEMMFEVFIVESGMEDPRWKRERTVEDDEARQVGVGHIFYHLTSG
jgi:hypothetical protein